jgi:hypothetical protein
VCQLVLESATSHTLYIWLNISCFDCRCVKHTKSVAQLLCVLQPQPHWHPPDHTQQQEQQHMWHTHMHHQ